MIYKPINAMTCTPVALQELGQPCPTFVYWSAQKEIEDSAARSAGVAVAAGSLGAQSAGGIPFLGRAERAAQESAKAPKCRSMVLSAFTHSGP